MPSLSRHIAYQFPTYFVTLERATEQNKIDEIETAGEYLASAPVTQAQRALINSGDVILEIIDGKVTVDAPGDDEL